MGGGGRGMEGGEKEQGQRTKRGQWTGHSTHLGVALKGAHLVLHHGVVLLAITESSFQTHLNSISGILVSTI